VRTKRWIEVDGRFAIGEGGGELLQAIDAHGSLAEAARRIGWSYRHAWGYVQRAERVLGVPLVIVRHGHGAKKGSVLTTEARAIITTLLQETSGDTALKAPVGAVDAGEDLRRGMGYGMTES
jgi:molybdate transport system regulatory protein